MLASFRGRKDCEHELALHRLAAGAVVGCYLLIAGSIGARVTPDLPGSVAWLLAAFEMAAIGILCHLALRPGVSTARRLAGILIDVGALSCCMHLAGETAVPLYPVYFVAIFANGSRLGTAYLLAANREHWYFTGIAKVHGALLRLCHQESPAPTPSPSHM